MSTLYEDWAKKAIIDRFGYIRHIYTCLYTASINGTSCIDPLMFHFPDLDEVFNRTEHSFIVGDAIKVTPVLEKSSTYVESFFPVGNWTNLRDYEVVTANKSEWKNISTGYTVGPGLPIHLRPGYMIVH